jgi:hypothetical protein
MAKFHGRVGYGETVEVSPGVYDDVIVEHLHYGEVIQNSRGMQEADSVNPTVSVGNSIRIVANAYAREHFFAIRYVEWGGVLWAVANVEVQRPRLILRLGEVYNGPTAAAP